MSQTMVLMVVDEATHVSAMNTTYPKGVLLWQEA